MVKIKIFIGADHGGFKLKESIKDLFNKNSIEYEDVGTHGGNPEDDYPYYAFKVAEKVSKSKNAKGLLICGTGTGMVIAANKVKGIRAAVAYDRYSAKMARTDNNTNVLCLRGRFFSASDARKILKTWLNTEFSGLTKHKRRLEKISRYERKRK